MPSISLALVTYNQAGYLRRFLDQYLDHGLHKIELIIVDDGSTDETAKILEGASREKAIQCHRIAHGSIARARNFALQHCSSKWLAFADTDCRLDAKYFEALVNVPSRFSQALAVEGAVLAPTYIKPPFSHSLENKFGGMYVTANMAFKVQEINDLGGFDEKFKNYREDSDLALRILEAKGSIPFNSEWIVFHPYVPRKFLESWRTAFKNQSLILSSEIRLYEKHRETYSRIRFHKDAQSTLRGWILKYSLRIHRDIFRYYFCNPGLGPFQKITMLSPTLQALVISLWEHLCLVLACMLQWKKLKGLKTR